MHAYLQDTYDLLVRNGFKTNDSILCLFDNPGLVFAMSGVSPGSAWYFSGKDSIKMNEHYLQTINPHPRLFVVVAGNGQKLPPAPYPPNIVSTRHRPGDKKPPRRCDAPTISLLWKGETSLYVCL